MINTSKRCDFRRTLAGHLLIAGSIAVIGMTVAGVSRAEEFDISANYTYENPTYSEPDSMFMIGFKPVTTTIEGTVPGLSDEALSQSVRVGMRSSPPVVCCSGADQNFRARAPLVVVLEQRASSGGGDDAGRDRVLPAQDEAPGDDRRQYAVEWKFTKSAPADGTAGVQVAAYASLYHGSDLLTQASGKLELPAAQAAAVPAEAMTALIRTVEGKLVPYPTSLVVPIAGGG
ncbi:MAG TPA: hypothetical protein VM689_24575 [Aliidongia sp.]|nr:hypothetical protein [Aliidongia sp.]